MWVIKQGGSEVRIYVQEHNESTQKIAARLQPINAQSVIHLFGWELPIVKVAGVPSVVKVYSSDTARLPERSFDMVL